MSNEVFTLLVAVGAVVAPLAVMAAAELHRRFPRRRSAVVRERTRREATEVALERAARLDRERQALLAFAAHDREQAAAARLAGRRATGAQVVAISDVMRSNLAAFEKVA